MAFSEILIPGGGYIRERMSDAVIDGEKEKALSSLNDLDSESGMSRLLRECLVLLLGASAPAKLKDIEARAALARGKLKP